MATLDYKNSLGRYRRYLSNMQSQPLWNASFWVSLTILLVIVMVVFFLRPTMVIISGLLGQVREQKVLLERMDKKIETFRLAEEGLDQARDGQEVLKKVLPESPMWKELANTLFQIATDSGVTINRIEVGDIVLAGKNIEEVKAGGVVTDAKNQLPQGTEKITFSIDATGEYLQIKDILTKIEKLGRMMVIENARITKTTEGTLNLNISGMATFFKYVKEEET